MEENVNFFDFSGLNDLEVEKLKVLLDPYIVNPCVELPWGSNVYGDFDCEKGVNVEANHKVKQVCSPAVFVPSSEQPQHYNCEVLLPPPNAPSRSLMNGPDYKVPVAPSHVTSNASYNNTSYCKPNQHSSLQTSRLNENGVNSELDVRVENSYNESEVYTSTISYPVKPKPYMVNVLCSDLNPLVSCFIPQKFSALTQTVNSSDLNVNKTLLESENEPKQTDCGKLSVCNSTLTTVASSTATKECKGFVSQDQKSIQSCENSSICETNENISLPKKDDVGFVPTLEKDDTCNTRKALSTSEVLISSVPQKQTVNSTPSWADVLKSNRRSQNSTFQSPAPKKTGKTTNGVSCKEVEQSSVDEDAVCLNVGKHLFKLNIDFSPVLLQPRGLVNSRNWCYINATLQPLVACGPFYTLLRNLPLSPGVERGKSRIPVLDSMVKLIYKFAQVPALQENMQPGQPFQPTHIYDMLSDLKPNCIKGQQEDAEEFLSYILNGLHEEMAAVLKNYGKSINLHNDDSEVKTNGHVDTSEGEEEWKVMGSRQRGVVTRLVAEHKSPISDLLGGQIKSFLTINGSNSSASVQPFFTLQLDIQAENVTTVLEALNQMIVKEPIHGYTCPKSKQEAEAYSRSYLHKVPPILIMHLKRFVYDKDGGCKKVMKKTEYPINLELKKELFSPEARKARKCYSYTLFAVMYHDGEEAIKGHYISDTFHHGSKAWIRCDDRNISVISESQVLSYNPPRVPYLLFYQMKNTSQDTKL